MPVVRARKAATAGSRVDIHTNWPRVRVKSFLSSSPCIRRARRRNHQRRARGMLIACLVLLSHTRDQSDGEALESGLGRRLLNKQNELQLQQLREKLEAEEAVRKRTRTTGKSHGLERPRWKGDGSVRSSLRRTAHGVLARHNVSACPAPVSPEKVCRQCQSAGHGSCNPAFKWSWTAPLKANDAATSLPGLRGIRGMEAMSEPGVSVVARWNQNNWPGLLSVSPVRAASEDDKQKMCRLWSSEHSYQSWPVLLGCPGRRPQEYEPTCANVGAVVEVRCALVDLAAGAEILGDVYDGSRWCAASRPSPAFAWRCAGPVICGDPP